MIEYNNFESGLVEDEESLDLVPDYLSKWKEQEIIWTGQDDDGDDDICLWFETNGGTLLPVAARSEMMVITGPQKTRKSLLLQCMLMANYIDDRSKTLGYKMDLRDSPIVLFDTEQPIRRTKKNRRRFHNTIGLNRHDKSYRIFNIRKYTHTQKLNLITHTLTNIIEEDGIMPGCIIIDQLADLCPARDVNDQHGVNEVLEYINLWQEMTRNQSLFCAVIHTNRGRLNTNGKLGVMLDQKTDCSFHVDIDFDTWISTVTHKEARDARCPEFTFKQEYDGTPRLLIVQDHDADRKQINNQNAIF